MNGMVCISHPESLSETGKRKIFNGVNILGIQIEIELQQIV